MRYQEEDDSYLKKGMKDEPERYPRPRGFNQMYRPNKPKPKAPKGQPRIKKTTDPNFKFDYGTTRPSTMPSKGYKPKSSTMPSLKKPANKKKAALGSMLSSLSSGASFRNQ